jgi:hypothetical protein
MPISAAFARSFSTVLVNRGSAAINTIELLIDAASHRVEGDGLSSFRLLASERPENAGEESDAFTCAIRLV